MLNPTLNNEPIRQDIGHNPATMLFFSVELLGVRPTIFGFAVINAVNNGKIKEAIDMIRDRVRDGKIEEIEWVIGDKLLKRILDRWPVEMQNT